MRHPALITEEGFLPEMQGNPMSDEALRGAPPDDGGGPALDAAPEGDPEQQPQEGAADEQGESASPEMITAGVECLNKMMADGATPEETVQDIYAAMKAAEGGEEAAEGPQAPGAQGGDDAMLAQILSGLGMPA